MTEAQRKFGVTVLFAGLGAAIGAALIALFGYSFFPDVSQRTANLVTLWGSIGIGVIAGALARWKL